MRDVVPRVDDLHHPEPLPHLRHRKDHRLLREIQVRQRVERIDVEADDGPVRCVGKLAIVDELVDRRVGSRRPWTRAWPCRSGSRCRRAACRRSRPPARWPSLRRERWTPVGVGSWSYGALVSSVRPASSYTRRPSGSGDQVALNPVAPVALRNLVLGRNAAVTCSRLIAASCIQTRCRCPRAEVCPDSGAAAQFGQAAISRPAARGFDRRSD